MDGTERQTILELCHDHPLAGHFGVLKTLAKINRNYIWPGLRQDVVTHIRECEVCQAVKARRYKLYSTLRPLEVPNSPWQRITLDFITDLPPSRLGNEVYNSILVVMDRFTKMAHYIPTRKTITAKNLASVFLREIIRLHGVPDVIVSDRGPILTSKFWKTFCWSLQIQHRLSTAFHPQTDGQTER